MRRWLSLILAGALLAGCGGAPAAAPSGGGGGGGSGALAKIKARGDVVAGVKADVLGFGYKNPKTGEFEGYEIDIAHAIAKAVLADPNKIKFEAVTAKTRTALLDSGEVDFDIATFTITPDREKVIDFSPVYYVDGIKLLVLKDSGIKGLKDLAGKTIGVAKGADTATRLQEKAKQLGIQVNFAEFETYAEILVALQSGRVQAFATDGSILKYYEQQDPKTVILPDRYSDESYGIAIKKGNTELKDLIAKVIDDMKSSGELQKLQQKWGIAEGSAS